jgi:hypothetical protein
VVTYTPLEHRTALRNACRAALARYPSLPHEWIEDEERTGLRVRSSGADGFDIQVVAVEGGIQLRAGSFHTHFDDHPATAAPDAVSLMLGLLGPGMRLRERRVNGKLRSCSVEVAAGPGWAIRETFGLFFWNPFGRRSERVYQNHHLPDAAADVFD